MLLFDLLPEITTIGRIKQWVQELLRSEEDTEEKAGGAASKPIIKSGGSLSQCHLGYEGKMLDDEATVAKCGIKDQGVLDYLEFEEEKDGAEMEKNADMEGKKVDEEKEEEKEIILLTSYGIVLDAQPMRKLTSTASTFKPA